MNNENEKQIFKLEVKNTTTETKEISLPHFRKNGCHAYKVYSEHKCIQVCYGYEGGYAIANYFAELAFQGDAGVECTEAEFTELYNLVSEKLKSLSLSL